MKLKVLFGLLLSFLALTMTGCGGGGGGGGGTTVSGVVAKGLVSGSTVKVFEIISSHNPAKARIGTTVLGQPAITAADGSFSVNIGGAVKKGGLLIQATGGTYTDEATGTLNTALSSPINAAFGNISGKVRRGESVVVSVTPFTEMGFQAIDVAANKPSDANIAAANGKVATTLGLTDVNILTTKPFAADKPTPAGATAAQISYSQALATVSQLIAGGMTLAQVEAQYVPDIKAGVLTQANSDAAAVARLNFLNSAFNKTGAAQDITVAVATSKTTVAIAPAVDKATITATVKQNSVNVPDGTKVNFIIKTGAGATLSAASATTLAGVANVDLTGTIDDAGIVVTASAGGVATDAPTVTFLNPNKPGAIAMTANPATGVTTKLFPVPVTLTATVSPVFPTGVIAEGTPVTFTITSGSGTLTSPTANTVAGVATVTLNSATVNTVTVTAKAGTVTSTPVSVPFIDQPTLAIVTISTTGTLLNADRIGGIGATLTFPTGLAVAVDTFSAPLVELIGTVPATGSLIAPNITVPVGQTPGRIVMGLIHAAPSQPTGSLISQTGAAIKVTFNITPGAFFDAVTIKNALGLINASVTPVNVPGVTPTSSISLDFAVVAQ